MKWFSIRDNGLPDKNQRVLTYSEIYRNDPELAYRILDEQFIPMCMEITHYAYLFPPILK